MTARAALALAACALVAALLAACGDGDDSPPTNPLDDRTQPSATSTATATPTETPTLPPTLTATPREGEPTPPPDQAVELAVGSAIELMAEFLAVPATDLTVADAEAVVWPDSCLGVAVPGEGCDDVLTAGFRIVLDDAFGNPHTVHADEQAHYRWAGETQATGTMIGPDGPAPAIEVDGEERDFLAVPGTRRYPAAAAVFPPGTAVTFAFDASPTGADTPVIAWIAAAGAE